MRAAVVHAPGAPEVMQFEEIPLPELRPGWVRIRVKAFGLSRSEFYARRGEYPEVVFPRVLGTQCVGIVDAAAPETNMREGQTVAAVMGGMGRLYAGSYAEYVLAPATHVMPLNTDLPWDTLAAIPKSFLCARGALATLDLRPGQTLLIRGGTSSVGMAALALAKDQGATLLATTRNPEKVPMVQVAGADQAILDSGAIAEEVQRLAPGGVHALLELIGDATLRDSLQIVAPLGVVCYMGVLGESAVIEGFQPLADIPTGVRLTAYASRENIDAAHCADALQQIVDGVAAGRYRANLDRVFPFDQLVAAHHYVEANHTLGTVVVTVP
jgi:NADPH:quinone reductase